MDKIFLKEKDIVDILAWRDENPDLVRVMPAPLKAIEIRFPHNSLCVKGIRSLYELKLHVSENSTQFGNIIFNISEKGFLELKKSTLKLSEEDTMAVITVYSSLMAMIAYARPEIAEVTTTTAQVMDKLMKKSSGKQKPKSSIQVTYIIKTIKGKPVVFTQGKRMSSGNSFSVRGHYRHYKNGKKVWIPQYSKGQEKSSKSRLYKLKKEN